MHKSLLFLFFFLPDFLKAQTAENIIAELRSINHNVANGSCDSGKGNIISNRAMNIFLSNKVGTYLSDDDDLSLYKNSVRFNTIPGTFSITHNLRQAKGLDEPVRSFVNIGARANIVNGLLSRYNRTHSINQLGFLVKKTWMGKPNTYFNKCTERETASANDKQLMDVHRATIINALEAELKSRDSLLKNGSETRELFQAPGENTENAKNNVQKYFYENLKEEYGRRFAELQADALIATNYFSLITTNWTIISIYLPVVRESIYTARSFTASFEREHLYPVELSLTHTRFWESNKYGRFFLKLNAKLFANNSFHSNALERINVSDYKAKGGTDTSHINRQKTTEIFMGSYKNFITPQANIGLIFIPATSHFGLSFYLEKNFGQYKALNGKIGLPVELIDKKGDPDLTFEFQFRFFDLNNVIQPAVKISDKTSIGFSIGIPFSKIVY